MPVSTYVPIMNNRRYASSINGQVSIFYLKITFIVRLNYFKNQLKI